MSTTAEDFASFATHTGKLSPDAVASLLEICDEQSFTIGQSLVDQGEPTTHLFFVREGLVRYFLVTPDGAEVNKSIRVAPCIVGSTVALVKGTPSHLSIRGLGPLSTMRIDWAGFTDLMTRSHELETFYRKGVEALFIEHEHRELSLLMESAEQRYQRFLVDYADVIDRIPLFHVASFLGITPVALSRIRKRLGMDGNTRPANKGGSNAVI